MDTLTQASAFSSAIFWFGVAVGFITGIIALMGLVLVASIGDRPANERIPYPVTDDPISAEEYDAEIEAAVEGIV